MFDNETGGLFVNDFFKWSKFDDIFFCVVTIIPFFDNKSLQIFGHATTAQLSCHVEIFVTIQWLKSRWEKTFPLNLNYDGKYISDMGPLIHFRI